MLKKKYPTQASLRSAANAKRLRPYYSRFLKNSLLKNRLAIFRKVLRSSQRKGAERCEAWKHKMNWKAKGAERSEALAYDGKPKSPVLAVNAERAKADKPKDPRRLHAGFAACGRKRFTFAAERRATRGFAACRPQRGPCKREAFATIASPIARDFSLVSFLFFQCIIIKIFPWFSNFLNQDLHNTYLQKKQPYQLINHQVFQDFERSNQNTYFLQRPFYFPNDSIQKGDLLGDCSASDQGELALGQNLLIAYMCWEGFNFEDAVLINQKAISKYTSLHIEKYDVEFKQTAEGHAERVTRQIPGLSQKKLEKLDKNGIVQIGSWVKEGDVLVGKIIPIASKIVLTHEKLLYDITGQKVPIIQEKSLRVPRGVSGHIIKISLVFEKEALPATALYLRRISIYIAEKHTFQVGDKISGRHGNKGIISKILSEVDMPYLPNGQCIDVLLNPLGVPSRMNVGQILECLLGLTGQLVKTKFKILCFDETQGYEASRSWIYSKLLESCYLTKYKWLFSKRAPGKFYLFDGRNGQLFNQSILVGYTYLMKLIHRVDEKIHARSTGPYSLITQQPLRGRAHKGGQRVGEMEVWALQGFGSAYTLQELLTIKSDDLQGRSKILQTLLKNTSLRFGTPETLRVVLRELQCLCLDLQLAYIGKKSFVQKK